jgi:excisionase family DNA binding protein
MKKEAAYYTTTEFAEMFRISDRTVRRMISRGQLPAIKVGGQWRIPREAVELFTSYYPVQREE